VWVFQGKNRLVRVTKPTELIFKEVRLVGWLSNCGKILEGAMLHFPTHMTLIITIKVIFGFFDKIF